MHQDNDLKYRIVTALSSCCTMALATVRPDGFPQATTVNYINDGLTLYFAADAGSQKTGNIKLNNKVSAAIVIQSEDFGKLAGVSLSGYGERIMEAEGAIEVALRLFQKIPQSRKYVPDDTQQIAVFSITPVAISLIDYSKGFGTSALLSL